MGWSFLWDTFARRDIDDVGCWAYGGVRGKRHDREELTKENKRDEGVDAMRGDDVFVGNAV
jgi:hypothetical protein